MARVDAVAAAAWIKAIDDRTNFVVLLLIGFIGDVGLYGTNAEAAFERTGRVAVVGRLRAAAMSNIKKGMRFRSDAEFLARADVIPRAPWKAADDTVALLCVWKGVVVLLRKSAYSNEPGCNPNADAVWSARMSRSG